MELTTRDYDDIVEIQLNIHDDTKLDLAIDQLRPEVLFALREGCLKLIDRQSDILARVQSRLAHN